MIIEKLNGTRYDMADYKCKTLDFNISSPSMRNFFETIDQRHGHLDLDTSYIEGRKIQVSFYLKSDDINDFRYLRSLIFGLMTTIEPFYIIDKNEPFKRWKVKLEQGFDLERIGNNATFTINFISDSAFSESVFTTLNPDEYSQMLQVPEENFNDPTIQYEFKNTTTFSVWNDGEIVDSREHYLKIELYCDATDLTIKNLTNGSEWKLYGDLYMYETVVIDGIRTLRNGVSAFKDTNRQLITLDKGWNEFQLNGVTSYSSNISFDFRFLYL